MGVHAGHGGPYNTCRHHNCVAYRARYLKRWRYERSKGKMRLVDAEPARMHIFSLEGADWSLRAIAGAAGVSVQVICKVRAGQPTMQREFSEKVLAVEARQVPSEPTAQTTDVFVSRVGSVRRIQALLRMGWSHQLMYEHSGVRTACVLHQQGRWVTRNTHDALAEMYRQISHLVGPSKHARTRSLNQGYLSPADWDNIDLDDTPDLTELPIEEGYDEAVVGRFLSGERVHTAKADRREIVARYLAAGRPLADLERAGWNVQRYYQVERKTA